jgi:2-aminoadipate transaminase
MMNYRFAQRAEILAPSVYSHTPGAIILSSGLAHPPLLPDLSAEAAAIAREHSAEAMQYGPLMGTDALREQIVRFTSQDGVNCNEENILVTCGAKHALDLACRAFLEPGDRVIVTRPTYMTALQIMRAHRAVFLDIGQDGEGLNADELEEKLRRLQANGEAPPKLLFDVPDFHNPTGITTSAARRRRLLELAGRYGFVILEDDPYRRLRFSGAAVAPIKALDNGGAAVSLGTVSKILAPGIRIGWAIGAPEIVSRMAMQKADGGACPFTQRIVAEFMRGDKMTAHLKNLSREMRRHRDAMIAALKEHLPEASFATPQGGYFLWVALPEGSDAEAVAALALEGGAEVSSGRLCFPNDVAGNYLRLAYSYPDADAIAAGVRILGNAYRRHRRGV